MSSAQANPTRVTRGPYIQKSCSNCKRRKLGCDGLRPVCTRCSRHPPRDGAPCLYATELSTGGRLTRHAKIDVKLTQDILNDFLLKFSATQFCFIDTHTLKNSFRPLGYIVYLWAHLNSHTRPPESPYRITQILAQIAEHTARQLDSTRSHAAPEMLSLIQTEVLLSLYFLETGRQTEGHLHCAAATSLVLTGRLHLLGGSQESVDPVGVSRTAPIVRSGARTFELHNAFWSVVVLNCYWVCAAGVPSLIPHGAPISTPWPTAASVAGMQSLPADDDVTGQSALTLLVKASILFERSMALSRKPLTSDDLFILSQRMVTFRRYLPDIETASPTVQMSLLTHLMIDCAILQLLNSYALTAADAQHMCAQSVSTVRANLEIVTAHAGSWEYVDPIFGTLLQGFIRFLDSATFLLVQNSAREAARRAMQVLGQKSLCVQRHLATVEL
ncbi:unnamed protein product [Mycena citricolor]|uniref:Zn(2)-C6 fungal-type domain-containing protein n=1 Tax=Mycena citricolor TaxID=2018698 RepID=A0AAD2HRV7_9AGAR|nr:unnamed protein product [Mycena citricolor]